MPYYGYHYKQQYYIPGVAKCTTPVFTRCHKPCPVKYVSCAPCASNVPKGCRLRKTVQSIPRCSVPCSVPCSSQCVETHVVEGHSSSCSTRSPDLCTMAFPQSVVQGGDNLCVSQCGHSGVTRCPQVCTPTRFYQHSSCPYSYQWSNSYQYNCGQQ